MNDFMSDFFNNLKKELKFLIMEDFNLDLVMVSVFVIIYVNVIMIMMYCVCVLILMVFFFDDRNNNCWYIVCFV